MPFVCATHVQHVHVCDVAAAAFAHADKEFVTGLFAVDELPPPRPPKKEKRQGKAVIGGATAHLTQSNHIFG